MADEMAKGLFDAIDEKIETINNVISRMREVDGVKRSAVVLLEKECKYLAEYITTLENQLADSTRGVVEN